MGFGSNLLQQAASQATSGLIGAGMGLLLEGHNDRRQIRQQQKLTDMQVAAQKNMGQFNYDQALKMWHATNYSAQMGELKKAGLNPGLMYGMSGGGGTTTNVPVGSAGGSQAPSGGREIMEFIGQGLNLQMLKSQIANMNADTRLKEVDANKKAGVDTKEAETRILSLGEGIENQRAARKLMEIDADIKAVEKEIASSTQEEMIMKITMEASQARTTVDMLENQLKINKATAEDQIKIVSAQLAGIAASNALTKALKTRTEAETKNLDAERRNIQNKITMWSYDNYINLRNMSSEERRVEIQKMLADFSVTDKPSIDIMEQAFDGIFGRAAAGSSPKPAKIGFK